MELSRREFLKATGTAAAGLGIGVGKVASAEAATVEASRTTLPFVPKLIGQAAQLKDNAPVAFTFPDAASPCAMLKMGHPVPGGVGPNRDIVAFSTQCTHMGCPVSYDASAKTFKCPCHFSIFDPEKSGQMVVGQATENLPSITLDYNAKDGSIRAIGVEGLIYGRQSNAPLATASSGAPEKSSKTPAKTPAKAAAGTS
ncbi:arsenate reductase (azurin) small subunit [Herbaspirillum sp. HC18]|nr:arsenate reductase (azurin) small subunit [Herbaspirillum sp. HC18]